MNLNEKIAQDFTPTFSASKLGDLCSTNTSESTKFRFLKQFKPFSEHISYIKSSPPKKSPPDALLSKQEKEEIKKKLNETINFEDLTFDDDFIIESFQNKLSQKKSDEDELSFLVNQMLLTDDEDKKLEATKIDEYFTAESDEETFIEINENLREEKIKIKKTNAHRYVTVERGKKLEKYIVEKINKEKNMNFIQNKSKKTVDFGSFKIVGIIDGISKKDKSILEIKTRSKFDQTKNTITNKERKQALTYMHMHGCDSCLFVESGPNGERKETLLKYDEGAFRQEILEKLGEFCEFAKSLTLGDFIQLSEKYSKINHLKLIENN